MQRGRNYPYIAARWIIPFENGAKGYPPLQCMFNVGWADPHFVSWDSPFMDAVVDETEGSILYSCAPADGIVNTFSFKLRVHNAPQNHVRVDWQDAAGFNYAAWSETPYDGGGGFWSNGLLLFGEFGNWTGFWSSNPNATFFPPISPKPKYYSGN